MRSPSMPRLAGVVQPRRPATASALLATALLLSTAALLFADAAPVRAADPAPAVTGATAPQAKPMVLPFIEDDYERALAEARARRVPLVIDAWAPW